jgi:hypothetical protein
MQRVILTFLAVVSLLLGVSASIGSQVKPAQADTTIPEYGAPDYVDGSPVGGGVGYLSIIDPSQADYVVDTAAELKAALASATSGQVVYVADGATITYDDDDRTTWYATKVMVYVPSGVTLAGGRGRATPGSIKCVDTTPGTYDTNVGGTLVSLGSGAKACGLNICGPSEDKNVANRKTGVGAGYGSEVYNNEIHGCGYGGVVWSGGSSTSKIWVHHNYIHHNQCLGHTGYGVQPGAASWGLIEGNIFEYSRHHMMISQGDPGAHVEFRYNRLGYSDYTQLDNHGQNDLYASFLTDYASDTTLIHHNTSTYTGQPFYQCRGIPVTIVSVYNNWFYGVENWGTDGAIHQHMQYMTAANGFPPELQFGYIAPEGGPYQKMFVHDNWFGTTPPPSTNVAPVLNTIGNKSIKEGATLSFTISGSDANGDSLTYSASNLPVGATLNSTNRTFSWTPSLIQAGVYTSVRFQVSDGKATDYEDITITVTDEVAPVLNAIGDKSINWGATLSFTISGSDANGDVLTYSASNLPVGATFDPVTQTFSWTPEDSQAGVYASIRFQVSDGSLSDTEDITITVSGGVLADVNNDGAVNSLDMIRVGQHWNETGESGWIPEDINKDGTVNVLDATLVGQHWTG